MKIMDTTDDAELAVRAVRAGAAVVREMYGDDTLTRFDKGGGDFATTADLAAEEAILDVLRGARPDDAVTGEESGNSGADGAERRWLVDPLCGTVNYAARNMLVGVNVALRAGGDVHVGATADPFSGEVFWTDGERALVRSQDGVEDVGLRPSAESRLVDLNLDPPFRDRSFRAAGMLGEPEFAGPFRPRVVSTTLAVAWVAAGRRAGYVTDGADLRASVHFGAGIALCRAAGCVLTGIDGAPLDRSVGGLVAAADERTHARLLEIVRRQG